MAKKMHDLIDEIYALAHIMGLLFEQVEEAEIRVNPHAVACFGKMITCNVIKLIELLHDKYDDP